MPNRRGLLNPKGAKYVDYTPERASTPTDPPMSDAPVCLKSGIYCIPCVVRFVTRCPISCYCCPRVVYFTSCVNTVACFHRHQQLCRGRTRRHGGVPLVFCFTPCLAYRLFFGSSPHERTLTQTTYDIDGATCEHYPVLVRSIITSSCFVRRRVLPCT